MSTKSVLRIVISASLLVAILLAVQVMVSKSEANTTSAIHPTNYYVGSDYFERHPSVIHPANYYAGSDYFERHPQDPYAGSDYFERHPNLIDK